MPKLSEPFRASASDRRAVARVGEWFESEGRALPWREASDFAWGVLVSEVMLQQTPVSRVMPRWREWMERWPSPEALASAEAADVVRAWGKLGYPRRALRLRECAQRIVAEHAGEVPRDEPSLRALPGIGAYTAAAVAAFAFGQRTVVLDTNVRRVIERAWGGAALPPGHINARERERAAALVPEDPEASVRWNIGAMELGALVCRSRTPACDECPLSSTCAWLAAGRPAPSAPARTAQSWKGSDRQVRGRILALLRDTHVAVNVTGHTSLHDVEPGQLDRCLATLVDDGLARAASAERGTYTL